MTKINSLRRFLLPCFTPPVVPSAAVTTTNTKKRLSTSLRDDIEDPPRKTRDYRDFQDDDDDDSSSNSSVVTVARSVAPPRHSKTMVIGTIFGHRRGHVWFCVQQNRVSTRPTLLLELPIPIHLLVKEMRCGLVRIALECEDRPGSEVSFGSYPLHSVPVWTVFCNGKKLGFAVRRKATGKVRLMLKTMRSVSIGAGVLPPVDGFGSKEGDNGELIYMRANYECLVGGPDSESFHLINLDEGPGQELSIFLLRSR